MSGTACLVVNYFTSDGVAALLESFARVELPDEFRVIVVDNSCDDAAWAELQSVARSSGLDIETVRSDQNLGYAGGNNLAFASAARFKPEVVIVINPDVTFESGSLRDAAAEVLALGDAASGAKTVHRGKTLSGLGTMSPWTGAARELAQADVEANSNATLLYPMGHFLALRSDTWRALGGLSDAYFLFCEELDLSLRLVDSGGRIATLKSIQLDHEKGMTTGAVEGVDTKSSVAYRHATRSRVILYRSHRKLKKYLVPMVASRLLWSIGVFVRSGPASAIAVIAGLRDGLAWRKTKVD